MKCLAIIPARGGSRGIPRKNVLPLLGKPMLAYTIEAALQTQLINRVVVSTDSSEIAGLAGASGAEVIWRPAEISGDAATSESALVHVLDNLRAEGGYEPDIVVFLQVTSPFRRPEDIRNAIETMQLEKADSLFSASSVHGFVWRVQKGKLSSLSYDFQSRPRRQDAPEDLMENGSIYIFKPWVLRKFNNRLGGKIATYRMDALSSFQVDEPGDLKLAEQLLSLDGSTAGPLDHSRVRLLVLDFDGVMTDNRVLVNQHGMEAVWCHRGDGWGIQQLKEAGVEIVVLSTEMNSVVDARCRKLGIACIHGCGNKLMTLEEIARQRSLGPEQVAYVGNDVNDLDCMKWVALPIAVADAAPEVRKVARIVTASRGGRGAVREVCDLILSHRRLPQTQAVKACS